MGATFLLIPILFGPLGVVLGFVGYSRGDRTLGTIAIVLSAVGLVLYIILLIIALSSGPPPPNQP